VNVMKKKLVAGCGSWLRNPGGQELVARRRRAAEWRGARPIRRITGFRLAQTQQVTENTQGRE